MTTLIGYARLTPSDPVMAPQIDALRAAGCERIFSETPAGFRAGRPVLEEALAALAPGDTLVVWRLERLAKSLPQLMSTVARLKELGIALRALEEGIDTAAESGRAVVEVFDTLLAFDREASRVRSRAGLDAASKAARVGRRRRLSDEEIAAIGELLASGSSYAEAARRFGVSSGMVYYHFPSDKQPSYGYGSRVASAS